MIHHDLVDVPVVQSFHGAGGKTGAHQAVTGGGGTAALHMAQHGQAGIHAGAFRQPAGQVLRHAGAFRHHGNDAASFLIDDRLEALVNGFQVIRNFRDNADIRRAAKSGGHRQIAAVPAHRFNHESAVMGTGRITNGINAIQNHVLGRIHAQAVVRAGNVVVNRGRNTGKRHFKIIEKVVQGAEGTVPAHDDELVDVAFLQMFVGLLAEFVVEKALGS